MGLQNVEKIEVQEQHKKSWFNRFKTKMGVAAAGGEDVLSTTGIWVITIVVGMVIVGLVVALIKKK